LLDSLLQEKLNEVTSLHGLVTKNVVKVLSKQKFKI